MSSKKRVPPHYSFHKKKLTSKTCLDAKRSKISSQSPQELEADKQKISLLKEKIQQILKDPSTLNKGVQILEYWLNSQKRK